MKLLGQNGRVFVARLVLSYVGIAGLFHIFEGPLMKRMVPYVERGIRLTPLDLEPRDVRIWNKQVQARVDLRWPDARAGKSVVKTVTLGIPARSLLVSPILVLTLLFAFQQRTWRGKFLSFGIAALGAPNMVMIDLPFALAAGIAQQMNGPSSGSWGFLDFWWFFMDNGGRQLIAITVAVFSIWLSTRVEDYWFLARGWTATRPMKPFEA